MDALLVRFALRRTRVVVRERISSSQGEVVFDLQDSVLEAADVAFYGFEPSRESLADSEGRPVARLVVMDWKWASASSEALFEPYIAQFALLADLLSEDGYKVVLGGHSDLPDHLQDDLAVARMVRDRAAQEVDVDPDCDVGHLVHAYRAADVVVGTRLHSCIMAMAEGTPAVAVAYQPKAVGVMANVGQGSLVLHAGDFSAHEARRLVGIATTQGGWDRTRAQEQRDGLLSFYARYLAA